MYLYYAMGGGLGHLSRTVTILKNAPSLIPSIRVLSTAPAPAFMDTGNIVIDCPPKVVLNDRQAYYAFFRHYVENHKIEAIVIDTFPGGIVGELGELFMNCPRLLLARHLNVEQYRKRLRGPILPKPRRTLVLEPLPSDQLPLITPTVKMTMLGGPVAPSELWSKPVPLPDEENVAVVHSQEGVELEALQQAAQKAVAHTSVSRFDIVTPKRNPQLFCTIHHRYTTIVCAAGYNMTALARLSKPYQRYILVPFDRRFDDQYLRAERFDQEPPGREGNQVEVASAWLQYGLKRLA